MFVGALATEADRGGFFLDNEVLLLCLMVMITLWITVCLPNRAMAKWGCIAKRLPRVRIAGGGRNARSEHGESPRGRKQIGTTIEMRTNLNGTGTS